MYARRLNGHRIIWWLCDDDGSSQPQEYILGLEAETQRRLASRINRADVCGPSSSNRLFNYLRDRLWEFKLNDPQLVRLYTIRRSNGYVILYAADKPNKRAQQADIARALDLAKRFLDEGERYDV